MSDFHTSEVVCDSSGPGTPELGSSPGRINEALLKMVDDAHLDTIVETPLVTNYTPKEIDNL